jgi:hypothetical protein
MTGHVRERGEHPAWKPVVCLHPEIDDHALVIESQMLAACPFHPLGAQQAGRSGTLQEFSRHVAGQQLGNRGAEAEAFVNVLGKLLDRFSRQRFQCRVLRARMHHAEEAAIIDDLARLRTRGMNRVELVGPLDRELNVAAIDADAKSGRRVELVIGCHSNHLGASEFG